MSTQADKATRKAVAQLIEALEKHEQTLAELVVDAQDAAEEAGVFSAGFFTGDNDDIPICVPEDADPLLDGARTGVQESLDELREWQKVNGTFDPAEDIEYLQVAPICPTCDGSGKADPKQQDICDAPCATCDGSGLDTAHTYPDGSAAACETCDGYGTDDKETQS